MDQIKEQILQRVKSTYKSLQTPDFGFVKEAQNARPYEGLLRNLRHHCVIEEVTPEEEDVCFSYMVQRHDRLWKLDLSMVSKYGLFVRLSANVGKKDFLTLTKSDLTDFERRIVETISSKGILLLPAQLLEQPVELTLFNTDKANTSLYQALFTDKPRPW